MLGLDHVDRPGRGGLLEGSEVALAPEHDVGGVLDLHQAPVVAGGKRPDDGAAALGETVQCPLQLSDLERIGLTAQLRKSATSVPSNIAEGCGREGERELARFLSIAAGSASESEYPLLLARDLGYLQPEVHRQLDDQVNEVKRSSTASSRRWAKG